MKIPTMIWMAVGLAACSVNGKSVGFGGDTAGPLARAGGGATEGSTEGAATTGATGGSANVPAAPPPSTCRAPTGRRLEDQPPLLDRPADPWLAVKDGRPVPIDLSRGRMATRSGGSCDAGHDHCLRDCSWFQGPPDEIDTQPLMLDTGGHWNSASGAYYDDLLAYRTVPATRHNLAVGVVAVALPDGKRAPADEGEALGAWKIGKVEAIDWAAGTVRFGGPGHGDPYFISATRVAVLRYQTGGKVEVIAGMDARAPAVTDLISPSARATGSPDPWAQVDAEGQPRAVVDAVPLTSFNQDCSATRDHCLRPWTWFVEFDGQPQPVRWDGHGWASPSTPVLDRPVKAYRTRAATTGELRPGLLVIAYRSGKPGPVAEDQAYAWNAWSMGEIEWVRDGELKLRDDHAYFATGNARIPVLWWMPGEKAAAVE